MTIDSTPRGDDVPKMFVRATAERSEVGTVTGCWRTKAACLGEDPELFFPLGVTGPAIDQAERAKAVCARCPVAAQCLEWALETGQDAGVWGGLGEDERRIIRRSRQRRRKRADGSQT